MKKISYFGFFVVFLSFCFLSIGSKNITRATCTAATCASACGPHAGSCVGGVCTCITYAPASPTPTQMFCDMGTCPSGYYCYQPPMPACPVGMACTQVMPRPYCRVGPSLTPTPNCSRRPDGDADCNGVINDLDYNFWLSKIRGGTSTCTYCSADFNKDTFVNLKDFEIWRLTRFN